MLSKRLGQDTEGVTSAGTVWTDGMKWALGGVLCQGRRRHLVQCCAGALARAFEAVQAPLSPRAAKFVLRPDGERRRCGENEPEALIACHLTVEAGDENLQTPSHVCAVECFHARRIRCPGLSQRLVAVRSCDRLVIHQKADVAAFKLSTWGIW